MCKLERHHVIINSWKKIFSRVLLERMKEEVEAILRDEQAGFRQERLCTDQIATLRMILEQSLVWNTSLYVVFNDYEKELDNVDRTTLWKLLQRYGIPEKIIRIIRLAYEPSTCQVNHRNTLTEPFTLLSGVRQGCLLSPFLFLLAMDWIMKETTKIKQEECNGPCRNILKTLILRRTWHYCLNGTTTLYGEKQLQ